jgi:selenocysteine-specific translation elongation factor
MAIDITAVFNGIKSKKRKKRISYILKKVVIFISSCKSQQGIGNLNDYLLNTIANKANLH